MCAERKAELASTARGVGVTLDGNRVSAVAPESMAAGAGITAGWILKRMGLAPAAIGARGPGPGEAMVDLTVCLSAEEAFAGLPQENPVGSVMPGREPKVLFVFENENPEIPDVDEWPENEAWSAP